MGIRGELFSTKVLLQNRTYFFNVKENRLGDLYLNIVESKNKDEGGFDRQSVILFAEDLQEFLKGFDESLRVLEKASREKRRGKGTYPEQRDSPSRDRYNDAHDHRDDDRKFNSRPRNSERGSREAQPRSEGRSRYNRNEDSSFQKGEPPFRGRSKTRDFGPEKFSNQNRSFKGRKDSERRSNDSRSEAYGTKPVRGSDTRKKRVVVRKK